MWAEVEDQLHDLLSARLYPAIRGDRQYAAFLARAGFGGGAPRDWSRLSVQVQRQVDQQAKREAHAITRRVASAGVLNEDWSMATVIAGPTRLYGLGPLWFPGEVMECCREEASLETQAKWLRTFLNLPDDDSVIRELNLRPGAELPAVQATSWPRHKYSRETWRHPKLPNYKYWGELEARFPQGAPRAVLPYLPE